MSRGVSVQGVSDRGVCVLEGKCPGGKCPGGKCPGGMCPWGKCPGDTCPGGFCPVTIDTLSNAHPLGLFGVGSAEYPPAANLLVCRIALLEPLEVDKPANNIQNSCIHPSFVQKQRIFCIYIYGLI